LYFYSFKAGKFSTSKINHELAAVKNRHILLLRDVKISPTVQMSIYKLVNQ